MVAVTQIDPAGLKAKMDARVPFCLLDVREPWEVARASLPGCTCIPLQEIPSRAQELDAAAEIIVMCQAGMRSQRAAEYLAAQGFSRVANLRGGIAAWARQFDPGLDVE
jgi:rhodanese-related sulfurtransferase